MKLEDTFYDMGERRTDPAEEDDDGAEGLTKDGNALQSGDAEALLEIASAMDCATGEDTKVVADSGSNEGNLVCMF